MQKEKNLYDSQSILTIEKINNILYCDSRGDKRFSAFYAKINFNGVIDSIENIYQSVKRTADGRIPGKGQPVDHCEISGKIYPASELSDFYYSLWFSYFMEHEELLSYAATFDEYVDRFRGKCLNCQADAIKAITDVFKANKVNIRGIRLKLKYGLILEPIRVINLSTLGGYKANLLPYQKRVDRQSVLGNPFYMKDEEQRHVVIDSYKKYFYGVLSNTVNAKYSTNNEFLQELYRLFYSLGKYGQLELCCWCYPKACHADIIKEYMNNIIYYAK